MITAKDLIPIKVNRISCLNKLDKINLREMYSASLDTNAKKREEKFLLEIPQEKCGVTKGEMLTLTYENLVTKEEKTVPVLEF
jgi:hypothetical protein